MSFGLGKDSPVVLSLGRANFNALIDRHGQWLRWRVAKKCACISQQARVDIHCTKCGGSGDVYDYQRDYFDVFRAIVRNNILGIPEEYSDSEIIEVYDSRGKRHEYIRNGDYLQIIGAVIPDNELVDVRVHVPIVKKIETIELEKVGAGYYRIPGISVEPSKFEGVYYRAAGDVLSVESVIDTAEPEDGEEKQPIKILGLRRDLIYTDSGAENLTAVNVEYVLPFRFIVLSQNLVKEDQEFINAHKGDAVCTFPYMFNVAENDILTVLSGTMTHKVVLGKRGTKGRDGKPDTPANDILNEFFVSKIDSIETFTTVYKEGVDFILIGSNQIHWIGNMPAVGENMSITYRYNPTYRVAVEIPMLRTSEDQRIPKKVVIKLFSAFAESKRVNSNG